MHTSLPTPKAGARIRLVTFLAATAGPDGSFNKPRRVNLRFDWTGPEPSHMCVAELCDYCDNEVHRIVTRRLDKGHRITGITPLRDGQTTMVDRRQPVTVAAVPVAAAASA